MATAIAEQDYRNGYIEPGLLEAFRFYYIMRTMLGVVLFTTLWLQGGAPSVLIGATISGLLLLGYLSHNRLCKGMKQYYLPLGFAVATLETMIVELLLRGQIVGTLPYIDTILLSLSEPTADLTSPFFKTLALEAWRVSPPLFFILIFVAWQYTFREVVIYAGALAAFNMLIPIEIAGNPEAQITFNRTLNFMRTMAFFMVGYLITKLVEAQRQQRKKLVAAQAKAANYAAIVENLAITRERNRMAREMN
ncbi:MAG: hypothetical protein AAF653_12495, partial [Chloroflexota bacterium]